MVSFISFWSSRWPRYIRTKEPNSILKIVEHMRCNHHQRVSCITPLPNCQPQIASIAIVPAGSHRIDVVTIECKTLKGLRTHFSFQEALGKVSPIVHICKKSMNENPRIKMYAHEVELTKDPNSISLISQVQTSENRQKHALQSTPTGFMHHSTP